MKTIIKLPFRIETPFRTYSGPELSDYRKYKKQLKSDFLDRCGYTNCQDIWFGGSNNFHIDHFKPHTKYSALKNSYSNLVYCCSYVNILKGDKDSDYLDPCDHDFNKLFYRNEFGEIFPFKHSIEANTMYSDFKLYLKRYSTIWMLEYLEKKMHLLEELISKLGNEEAKDLLCQITFEYLEYKSYLNDEL